MDSELYSFATNVDRLVNVEMTLPGHHTPDGEYSVLEELYEAAREHAGGPICHSAAQSLRETVDEGDYVLITTGAGSPPHLPKGETDGPPGAVVLAMALAVGCGANPVLVTEESRREIDKDVLITCGHACGLNVLPVENQDGITAISIEFFPDDAPRSTAAEFLDRLEPSAAIATEKLGPNREGVTHSSTGMAMDDHGGIAPLFELAADWDILTVGIGDNGNEIGFGTIEAAVREYHPTGDSCQCPCNSGIANTISMDELIVASTSNWGAYGLACMLAILEDEPEAMHTPADEELMIKHSIKEGCDDGVYGRPLPMVDGMTLETQLGVVAMLNDVVDHALSDEFNRDF